MKAARLSSGILALAICCAPAAMAANGPAQGDTSGPAAGKQTTPSTEVQKNAANSGDRTMTSPNTHSNSSVAGGPGVEGKPGGKSGKAAGPGTKQ